LSPAVVSSCPATSGIGAEQVAGAGRDGGDDRGEPPVGDGDLGGECVDAGGERAQLGFGGLDRVGQVGGVDGQRGAPSQKGDRAEADQFGVQRFGGGGDQARAAG
jgi:hypothetical protein